MAVEGDAHRGQLAYVGELTNQPEHRVMAEVHTVVDADGDDRAGTGVERRREAVEVVDDAHDRYDTTIARSLLAGLPGSLTLTLVVPRRPRVGARHRACRRRRAARRRGRPVRRD